MPALRLGLIGCGKVVEVFHVPAIQAIPEAQVVAVMDTDPARANAVGDPLGVAPSHRHNDYRRLLEDRVDAVSISTPPSSHREIAVTAAAAGKHVLCEKPMAISVADADAMIDGARRAGVALSLHHNYLWFPENQAAQQVIRDGRLGRIVYTCINCLGLPYFGGTWRLHQPEISGGGILLDMLHLIYLTNAFHGSLPTSVDARVARIREEPIRVEDFATVRLDYQGGIGEINVSWGRGWGGTQLMGTRGRLIYDYDHFTTVNYERPDRLRLITDDGEADVAFPPAPPFSVGPFRQFVVAVRDGRALEVTGEDGRTAVEVALAGYESAALHTAVAIPLAPSDPVYQHGIAGLARLAGASRDVVDLYGLAP
ncbi:MAG: Gfo/Idh/MocA family protein [Armatimonadota bacterium]